MFLDRFPLTSHERERNRLVSFPLCVIPEDDSVDFEPLGFLIPIWRTDADVAIGRMEDLTRLIGNSLARIGISHLDGVGIYLFSGGMIRVICLRIVIVYHGLALRIESARAGGYESITILA